MSEFFNIVKNYDRGFFTLGEAKKLIMREADRLMFKAINASDNDKDTLGFFKILTFLASQGEDAFFHYVMHAYEEIKNEKTA